VRAYAKVCIVICFAIGFQFFSACLIGKSNKALRVKVISRKMYLKVINESGFGVSNTTFPNDDVYPTEGAFIFGIMHCIYTLLVILIGLIGNVLSAKVFLRQKLRKLSSRNYLLSFCVTDSCFLLISFVSWLECFDIKVFHRNFLCQSFVFTSGLCNFLSVWLVLSFTVERLFAMLPALERKFTCTVRRSKCVIAVLIMIGLAANLQYLIFAVPQHSSIQNNQICGVWLAFLVSKSKALNFILTFSIV